MTARAVVLLVLLATLATGAGAAPARVLAQQPTPPTPPTPPASGPPAAPAPPTHYVVAPADPPTDTTVEVKRQVVATRDRTRGDVEDQAVNEALAEAIQRAVGVQVQALQTDLKQEENQERVVDVFQSIVQVTTTGRVIASDKIEDGWGSDSSAVLGRQDYYWVRLRVTVARERGRVDPGFLVSVAMNKDVYEDKYDGDDNDPDAAANDSSDSMVATIRPTQDSYVTVFVVRGGTVEVVFPNSHWSMRDNFAKGGKAFEFPSQIVRARYSKWRASVPDGLSRSRELVAVVATKTPVPFEAPPTPDAPTKARGGTVIETPKVSIAEFNQWLVRIPTDQRAVNYAHYEVTKRRKR